MKKFICYLFFSYIIGNFNLGAQNKIQFDSVNKYYLLSKDINQNLENRLNFALRAKEYSDKLAVDSIKLNVQRQLAFLYFSNDITEPYAPLNKENLQLAYKLNDSSAITVASTNLGSYYRVEKQNDSSYYYYSKALDYYSNDDISLTKATALLDIADIQQEEKAYVGAEQDAISAIKVLNQLPTNEDALHLYWNLYNLLAFISESTLNKDKAFEYYDRSITYSEQMEDGFGYEIYSINNKANTYRKFGEYKKALDLFQYLESIREEYEEDEPDFYPTILINIAKTKFESEEYNFLETEKYLKDAYNICKSIDDKIGVMAASLELSRLYLKHNKNNLAREYGKETLKISNEISNNEYKMDALLNLSYLYEGEVGKQLLRQHINLSDSLLIAERLVENKFARVKFDTDQIEAKNEKISKENFYLLLLTIGLTLTGILIYIVVSQRAKNKELRLVQEQQKANEEIYNLMLGQQDKVDEARAQEKIRVSKDLHDGVLGRLFGVRLSLDSLNFSDGKEAMTNRANYIGQLKTIEDDIRKISHEMNTDFVSGSGFMDIVTELIENQTKAYGFTYEFNYTDDFSWEVVPNKTKINIYRILQESMQNIHKHADAKHVKFDILREKNEIIIYIVDDGKGFDTSKSKKGIGLKNMNSRVADVKGEILFFSELEKGTTVQVKIPYKT